MQKRLAFSLIELSIVIGKIIVYGHALFEHERQEIEKYLSKKWKIKLS